MSDESTDRAINYGAQITLQSPRKTIFSVQSGQNALKSILVKVCFGKIKVHSEANFPLFGVLKPHNRS